jgi:hypothetical protein
MSIYCKDESVKVAIGFIETENMAATFLYCYQVFVMELAADIFCKYDFF